MKKELEQLYALTETYLRNTRADGMSDNTQANYSSTLSSFLAYLEESGDAPDIVGVMNWKAYLSNTGNKTSTISQRMRELRRFFTWAVEHKFLDENPIPHSTVPRRPKRKPYANLLTEEQFKLLLAEEKPKWCRTGLWARNRCISILFLVTGLRNTELRELTPGDMDAENGTIKVWNGKGDKFRVVDYPEIAQVAVRQYLASGVRPSWLTDQDYLLGTEKPVDSGVPGS